jgi:NAD(P)-dependent dehydrogenase (short-subunit alcohol dehydrogenase family)
MSIEIDLSGNSVLVTGAGRGLGKRIAHRFAEAGADVVGAARTESELEALAEEIEAEHGVDVLPVPTDLADVDDIQNLIESAVEAFGAPEILVNNAGANIAGPPLNHTADEIDTMLGVNVRGLFLVTQYWARAFQDSPLKEGRVINVSSVVADLGVPAMTLYGGTKAAVRAITQGFAAELAGDGVTVNSVSPGLTRVDRTEVVMDEHGDELFAMDRIPLGRVGEPEDIADACLFFASDLASYVTGEDLLVDGGVEFTAGLYK